MLTRSASKIAIVLGLLSLGGCNAVTGVDDLTIDTKGGGTHVYLEPLIAVPGITITDISLYQSLKVPLMTGSPAPAIPVPVIAGKDAVVRIFVQTDGNYTGGDVTVRLFLEGTPLPIEVKATALPAASSEADMNSTINIKIPGASLGVGANFKVILGKPSGPIPLPATALTYPAEGWAPLGAVTTNGGLKLQIVPVQYGADGSNRSLDVTDEIKQKYADGFMAMYPVPNVEVSVHDPVPYQQQIFNDGTGWEELLSYMTDLRAQEGTPADVYWFSVFQPGANFLQYCGSGCVLGLANLPMSPQDSNQRSAIGVAYFDGVNFGGSTDSDESIETAVHEIGHTHGRQHSPSCMAAGPDPAYPYSGGFDGTVWGYNLFTNELSDPSKDYDLMGYCSPNWISDYTYGKLFERVTAVNGVTRIDVPDAMRDRTYDRILINHRGEMKWLKPIKLALPPHGEDRSVVIESNALAETVSAQLTRFDHLDGGILLWPSTGRPVQAVRFDYGGKTVRVTR